MKNTPQNQATLYLFGYDVAAYRRYYQYCQDYTSENELLERAASYHLAQVRDAYRRSSETLALELGIKLTDIVPDNYDPQLEAMNELEGRSPAESFIRRTFGPELYTAFHQGSYIGGEIGWCSEIAKAAISETANIARSREAAVTIMKLKLEQFDVEIGSLPSVIAETLNAEALRKKISNLEKMADPTADGLRAAVTEFFDEYEQLTEYYRGIRDEETGSESNPPVYFLSYSHKNRRKADQIEIQLLRSHRRVWRDETDLRAGSRLVSNLYNGINDADVFLAVLTTAYLESRFCMAELEQAVHRELETERPRVVALRVSRNCEVPSIVKNRVWFEADNEAKLALVMTRLLDQEDGQP